MRVLRGSEFEKFFNDHIILTEYRYKFLSKDVELIQNGTFNLYSYTFIVENGKGWIVVIHSEAFSLYGNDWNDDHITAIKDHLDLHKFTNYQLKGDRDLILALIQSSSISNVSIEKERLFYRCEKVNSVASYDGTIRLARFDDASNLAPMLQMYYHEEYHGDNDKQIEDMLYRINISITNQSIYVLEDHKHDILSFCTVNNPDIGILFTSIEHRRKGYGKKLLAYCSQVLLKKVQEIYLMTDRAEVSSNATVSSVGFNSYYEFSYIWINETEE